MRLGTLLVFLFCISAGNIFFLVFYSPNVIATQPIRQSSHNASSCATSLEAVRGSENYNSTSRPFLHFFGITAPFNHDAVKLISQTWGSRVDVTWYSDAEDVELGDLVVVNDSTYLAASKRQRGYQYMTQKLLWCWNHTMHNFDADWYVRVYDDNYVFLRNVRRALRQFNSDEPILIGRVNAPPGAGGIWYMDGGYGWAISRAALQAWKPALDRCVPAVAANMRSLLVSQERCKLPPGFAQHGEYYHNFKNYYDH